MFSFLWCQSFWQHCNFKSGPQSSFIFKVKFVFKPNMVQAEDICLLQLQNWIQFDAKCDALTLYSSSDWLYKAVITLQVSHTRIIWRNWANARGTHYAPSTFSGSAQLVQEYFLCSLLIKELDSQILLSDNQGLPTL